MKIMKKNSRKMIIGSKWCNIIFVITWMIVIGDATKQTNVLFIIVDDLRPALGCYGDTKAYTPNVDNLAKESFLFNNAYAQQALCAPSRNSMLTSRRPDTLHLYDFYSYWRKVAGNYTTLPQHLRNNGYTTASFGKIFHPGVSCNYNDDSPYSWSEKPFHPSTQCYKDAPVCTNRHSLPASNLVCPVRVSQMPNGTLPDIETLKAAKKFLNSNRKKPFFLAVGFQKPHIPFKYPKRFLKYHPLTKFTLPSNYEWPKNVSSVSYNPWMDIRRRSDIQNLNLNCPWEKIPGSYAKKIIQSYYASVSYIDDLIGKLLVELDILNLRSNTVIVMTSDHGWSLGEHAVWAKYSNFEVSLRVPLLISIPRMTHDDNLHSESYITKYDIDNHCNGSKIITNIVELIDIFPTIAELVGVSIPKCSNVTIPYLCTEGSSLVPLMENSLTCKSIEWKNIAISQYPRPSMKPKCKRSSDEPSLHEINIMGYSLRTLKFRYTAWISFSVAHMKPDWNELLAEEMYDHSIDFEENLNIANIQSIQQIKSELRIYLKNIIKSI